MSGPTPELADIFRQHGPAYRQAHPLPLYQHRLMQAIETCRTALLGGSVECCDHCQYTHIRYRSCRNRHCPKCQGAHCPKCQGAAREKWLQQRQSELLPTEYFHVVFTLPEPIAAIAFFNKEAVYGLLFRATAETLLTIARDPKRLGVETGFFAVLHTCGHTLHHHPHLHCVIPGGGLSPDRTQWLSCLPIFFLPVRVLSRVFRRLFLTRLRQNHAEGRLTLTGHCHALAAPQPWQQFLASLQHTEWVVYAKPPFGGPTHVLRYLARYTHRVAISNSRLVSMSPEEVTFTWKDYRHDSRQGIMTLSGVEFLRRFLLHLLPRGFVRVRHSGLL